MAIPWQLKLSVQSVLFHQRFSLEIYNNQCGQWGGYSPHLPVIAGTLENRGLFWEILDNSRNCLPGHYIWHFWGFLVQNQIYMLNFTKRVMNLVLQELSTSQFSTDVSLRSHIVN